RLTETPEKAALKVSAEMPRPRASGQRSFWSHWRNCASMPCAAAGRAAARRNRIALKRRLVGRLMAFSLKGNPSEGRPRPERGGKRAFVEIVELAADRHAMRQPRHLDVEPGELVGDVVRGGLALDGGVDGEDHLRHAAGGDARDQRADVQVV